MNYLPNTNWRNFARNFGRAFLQPSIAIMTIMAVAPFLIFHLFIDKEYQIGFCMTPSLKCDFVVARKLNLRENEMHFVKRKYAVFKLHNKGSHPTNFYKDGTTFVKRIDGLPGQQIFTKNGQIYLAGRSYPLQPTTYYGLPLHPNPSTLIPPGKLFVANDHPRSFDSRYQDFNDGGFVDTDQITGIVIYLWNWQRPFHLQSM